MTPTHIARMTHGRTGFALAAAYGRLAHDLVATMHSLGTTELLAACDLHTWLHAQQRLACLGVRA